MNRREFINCVAAVPLAAPIDKTATSFGPTSQICGLEKAIGGRLGVYALDAVSGRKLGWRAGERFCHCSTFKLSLVAMAFHESDCGNLDLSETMAISPSDIVAYAPIVEESLSKGYLPIFDLMKAAQINSDNAAANILMRRLGGPQALTRFWRKLGDKVSRLDGYEPAINIIPPGTQENSTTPEAIAQTIRRILLGNVLQPSSRKTLLTWMEATTSGSRRIRAALPAGWRGFDKTGTGARPSIGNKTNDIALLVAPASESQIIVAAFFEDPNYSEHVKEEDEHVLRRIGEIVIQWSASWDSAMGSSRRLL